LHFILNKKLANFGYKININISFCHLITSKSGAFS
jgi:hypothetical protein